MGAYTRKCKPLIDFPGYPNQAEYDRAVEAFTRWGGHPPYVPAPELVRSRRVFWAGDSGLLHYRASGKGSNPMIDVNQITYWSKVTTSIGAGYTPVQWLADLKAFIRDNAEALRREEALPTPSGSGSSSTEHMWHFPPDVHCFVYDNLNGCALKCQKTL